MSKEFIPYEQALELKELGFDEPCLAYWYNETPTNSQGQCLVYYKKPWDNQKIIRGIIRDYYYAPTFSQAFRWFREKYGLMGSVCEDVDGNFSLWTNKGNLLLQGKEYKEYKTYEEAELACIIKLIEIVKGGDK
jgi:hypothetical protein